MYLFNLNPAATLAAMQGRTLPPGAVRARVIVAPKPARKAKAAHEGPFLDVAGRWHWANGRMMARVDAAGLGLSWPMAAPAPRAKAAPKRTGPFVDVRGRWHHATGAFMSNVDAIAQGLIRVS